MEASCAISSSDWGDARGASVRAETYRIADNQTATIAEWSFEILPIDLKELRVDGFNFGLPGYNADTLEKVLAPIETVGLVDPNDVLKAAGADCGTIEAIQTDTAVCLRGRGRKSAAIRQLLNRTGLRPA